MKINTTEIYLPHNFNISTFNIERKNRLANGKQVTERIATKRKFKLDYNYISGDDLQAILDEILADTYFDFEYEAELSTNTVTACLSSSVDRKLLTVQAGRMYVDISLEFEEQ